MPVQLYMQSFRYGGAFEIKAATDDKSGQGRPLPPLYTVAEVEVGIHNMLAAVEASAAVVTSNYRQELAALEARVAAQIAALRAELMAAVDRIPDRVVQDPMRQALSADLLSVLRPEVEEVRRNLQSQIDAIQSDISPLIP